MELWSNGSQVVVIDDHGRAVDHLDEEPEVTSSNPIQENLALSQDVSADGSQDSLADKLRGLFRYQIVLLVDSTNIIVDSTNIGIR